MNYKQMLDKLAELEQRIRALEQNNHTHPVPPLQPGCRVCGLGSDGRAYGYVCNRTDCPTAVTCNIQDAFK